jgi:dTDP-4-amino-4,6-dideoxygalactose transaminase
VNGAGPVRVPFSNPGASYLAHQAKVDEAIARALSGDTWVFGPEEIAFESEFASAMKTKHGVGTASGTDALRLALRVAGVGPGDEVITVALTAVATVAAIETTGATPVLVDVDFATFTMSPRRFAEAITPKTKAVIPVHIFGRTADMDPILETARANRIYVIEDCAQAAGASYRGRPAGSMGDLAAFSFSPASNLGAMGNGGMLLTSDAAHAEKARAFREHGLDELQSAILRAKLPAMEARIETRSVLALRYRANIEGMKRIAPPFEPSVAWPGSRHAWRHYVVRSVARDALASVLRRRGIQSDVHYLMPVHRYPAIAGRARVGELPETDRASAEVLSLPLWPEIADPAILEITRALREFESTKP